MFDTGPIIMITVFMLIVAIGIIMLVLVYQKKQLQYLNEKEQMNARFEKEILETKLDIQEQTLQYISNELHDNFGQVASLIKINLHTVPLNDPALAAQKIEDTRALTRQLITDIKALSVSLNSDRITRQGLAAVLQSEMERINKTGVFKGIFEMQGEMPSLDNDTATILYRMSQEVLNNMIKHSGAAHITLKLFSNKNLITLAISDDGKGFNVEETMKRDSGAGLYNLHKRATLIKASLSIQSNPEQGTQVTIELPYSYAPSSESKTGPG